MSKTTALVASDDPVFRRAVADGLSPLSGCFHVIAEAASPAELLVMAQARPPSLLMLDQRMDSDPQGSVLPLIHRLSPRTQTLLFCDVIDVPRVVWSVQQHVRGCIDRNAATSDLCRAVSAIRARELWFPRNLLADALAAVLESERQGDEVGSEGRLTEREGEIVSRISVGMTNKEIAHDLGISPWTVKEHLRNVFGKRGVARRMLIPRKRPSSLH